MKDLTVWPVIAGVQQWCATVVQELTLVNFKVAHLMRAVHSVFEGAPTSGEDLHIVLQG